MQRTFLLFFEHRSNIITFSWEYFSLSLLKLVWNWNSFYFLCNLFDVVFWWSLSVVHVILLNTDATWMLLMPISYYFIQLIQNIHIFKLNVALLEFTSRPLLSIATIFLNFNFLLAVLCRLYKPFLWSKISTLHQKSIPIIKCFAIKHFMNAFSLWKHSICLKLKKNRH